jgi:hypothetical protein
MNGCNYVRKAESRLEAITGLYDDMEKMKRYFRCIVSMGREEASEMAEIEIPEGKTQEEAEEMAGDEMLPDLLANNVDSWTREISREEYKKEMN